jgi:hypothetical protein
MGSEISKAVLKLRRAFADVSPPNLITQDQYDTTTKRLRRLARLHPGDQAEAGLLREYAEALRYGHEIQSSLLAYVMPFFIEAWREDLLGTNTGYGGFVEDFYPVMANKNIFDVHLKPTQTAAVSDFMRDSIIEEIDDQRGLHFRGASTRPYGWVRALTTYGVLLPDIEQLWNTWWSIDTIGKAISVVQYVSCLMYSEYENPVFAPWTPNDGGGPPCLWEFEGNLYTHRWLENNVAFLRRALSPESVLNVLQVSVDKLRLGPEYKIARGIQEDWPLCEETVASRCEELPRMLATLSEPGKLFGWSI